MNRNLFHDIYRLVNIPDMRSYLHRQLFLVTDRYQIIIHMWIKKLFFLEGLINIYLYLINDKYPETTTL